jgi:hypothetical protein
MHQPDLIEIFITPLESRNFDYLITGSVASTFYGEPRLTHDIDLVIMLRISDIDAFISLFPASNFYCPPKEIIHIELSRRPFAHFNLVHHDSGYKADIYPFTGDPLHSWAFKNRRRIELDDEIKIWVAPPEYVILRKLQYFREGGSDKHLSDIKKMINSGALQIDSEVFQEWIEQLELQKEWQKALNLREFD